MRQLRCQCSVKKVSFKHLCDYFDFLLKLEFTLGIYANKCEATNWKGDTPLTHYALNEDDNPKLIKKKVKHQLEYIQELAVRYLRPPTPPTPGEIIIRQVGHTFFLFWFK